MTANGEDRWKGGREYMVKNFVISTFLSFPLSSLLPFYSLSLLLFHLFPLISLSPPPPPCPCRVSFPPSSQPSCPHQHIFSPMHIYVRLRCRGRTDGPRNEPLPLPKLPPHVYQLFIMVMDVYFLFIFSSGDFLAFFFSYLCFIRFF